MITKNLNWKMKKNTNGIRKISNKHEIELNAFKLKMKSSFDEYKKNRALSYEK